MGSSNRSQDPYFTYAYGDEEPRKPHQFDGQGGSEERRMWPNRSNYSQSQQGVELDSSARRDSHERIGRDNLKLPFLVHHPSQEGPDSFDTKKRSNQRASSTLKMEHRFGERRSVSPKQFDTVPQWRKLVNVDFQDSEKFLFNQSGNISAIVEPQSSKKLNKKNTSLILEGTMPSPIPAKHRIQNSPVRGYGRRSDEDLDFGEDAQSGGRLNVSAIEAPVARRNKEGQEQRPPGSQRSRRVNVRSISNENKRNNASFSVGKKEQEFLARNYYDSTRQNKNIVIKKGRSQNPNAKGIEHLILLKDASNHRQNMQEYLRRRGLDEDTKIFCFNSKDTHIKRALENFGWVENPNIASSIYHLKWSYRDSENEYRVLSDGQYYNHFANNQELTMKSGLMKNLLDNSEFGSNALRFFPRCYELGQESQTAEFREDFERTALSNLVKNLWKYVKTKISPGYLKAVKERFWTKEKLKEEKTKLKEKKNAYQEYRKLGKHKKYEKYIRNDIGPNELFYKKRIVRSFETDSLEGDRMQTDSINRWWELSSWIEEERRDDFVVELNLVFKALRCLRTIVRQQRQKTLEEQDCYNFSDLSQKTKKSLFVYSKWTPPRDITHEEKVIFILIESKTR